MRKTREPLDLDGTLRRTYVALALSILSLLLEIAKVLKG